MKISTFKLYKTQIITFIVIGSIFTISAFIFLLIDGTLEKWIIPCIVILIGVAVASFPILLNYKQLNRIILDHESCISYSAVSKKLCEVDYNKDVFYSFFDVKFTYAPAVKFIAISNMTFECDQNTKNIFEKKFYGAYNRKKIIIFPYDNQIEPFLNLEDWHKIDG